MDKDELNKKIMGLEQFVNEKLQTDLKNILDARNRLYEQIAEYSQLRSTIQTLEESGVKENLKTRMDIGCGFFMQAVVPNPSRILVCVGYGFFVEMSYAEALNFISKKIPSLEKRVEHLSEQSNHVKALMKVVLQGLNELQTIVPVEEKRNTDL